MTTPIDNILPQLRKVKQRQPGQWSACCPAHADNGPSLSVRENPDGAVLLHCFAGCTVGAVADALGLDLAALFPPRHLSGKEPPRPPRLLTAAQALELLNNEAHLVAMAAGNLAHGVVLNENDRARLKTAAQRIAWLAEEALPLGGRHGQR